MVVEEVECKTPRVVAAYSPCAEDGVSLESGVVYNFVKGREVRRYLAWGTTEREVEESEMLLYTPDEF